MKLLLLGLATVAALLTTYSIPIAPRPAPAVSMLPTMTPLPAPSASPTSYPSLTPLPTASPSPSPTK